jgi:biotin carboxyl carrier protein
VLVATLTGDTAGEGTDRHQGERLYVSERLVISPCAGIFQLAAKGSGGAAGPVGAATTGTATAATSPAGTPIEIGDLVGLVSGTEVRSPFAGDLMGVLAHPGERVQPGQPIAWLRAR